MPVVSVCPYCNRGRVRAADDAIGTTAKCPSCGSEFTVIPSDEEAVVAAGSLSPSSSSSVPSVYAEDAPPRRPVATPHTPPKSPTPTLPLAAETLPDATPAVPSTSNAKRPVADPDELPDPARLPGLIAAAIALAGLVAWMIPDFGRLVWLVLAVVAAVVGGLSLLAADRKKLFAWIGLGTAGGSLLVCLALPSLLGEGWWPTRGYNPDEAVAIGDDGEQRDGRKEIDATKADWFKDGVRVRVVEVRREAVSISIPASGGKKATRKSVPDVWQITVEVSNDGGGKPPTFTGWAEATPAVVRTAANVTLKPKAFDTPPTGGPPTKPQLLPSGVSTRQTLYFDPPPPDAGGSGSLELPVSAFGGSGDPVRFMVPFKPFTRPSTGG